MIREKNFPQIDLLTENTSKMTAQMCAVETATRVPSGFTVSPNIFAYSEGTESDNSDLMGSIADGSREQEKNGDIDWFEED